MKNKKLFNNKIANGLISLITIIILLSSILATSIYYGSDITGFVVSDVSIEPTSTTITIKEVEDIKELNQLNEGWYEIRNGYVYYLDSFISYVPLYIRVKNPEQQNGLLVVDADGTIGFDESFRGLPGTQLIKEEIEEETKETTLSQITGEATGLEKVSGFVTVSCPTHIYDESNDKWTRISGCRYLYSAPEGEGTIEAIYDLGKNELASIRGTGQYVDISSTTYKVIPPPTSPPGQVPSAPHVPQAPLLPPDPKNIRVGVVTPTSDGFYFKHTDGSLSKWDGTKWEPVTNTYDITVKDPNGVIKTIQIEATTPSNAKGQIPKGFTVVSEPKKLTEIGRPTGEFRVEQLSGETIVTNGVQSYFVPLGKDAVAYAAELTDKAKINEEYNKWREQAKLPDNQKTRELFKKYPPQGVNTNLIDETLGLTAAQKEDAKKEKIRIETIPLPDGKYLFIYKGKEYVGEQRDSYPSDLQLVLDFKDKYKTAILQEGFRADSRDVYFYKGSYIDERGVEISEATKIEKIGENEYFVTYKFEKGKKIPTSIVIDAEKLEISENVLKALESKVGKEDTLYPKDNQIVVEKKPSITKEGKEDTESYREIITKTTLTYDSKSLLISETLTEIKDKDNNIIELKETKQTYKYDTKRNQEIPEHTIERIYEKKEGEKSIDRNTADYTEITTDSSTGEPLEFIIREGGQLLTATYNSAQDKIFGDKKAIEQLDTLRTQFKVRRYFAYVERIFTEFRGLGYYATLFFDDDSLLKWRDNVDRAFATLYLGVEYWSSAICATYLDGEDEGIAYAETPQGLAQVGAHIEATISQPIINEKGEREFVYRITFNVRNGDFDRDPRAPEEMNINVILKGERTAVVFKQEQKVKRGSQFSKIGRNAIVQDSKTFFNEVCLTFDKIPLRWKLEDKKELCNIIQESIGTVTAAPAGTVVSTGGEGDINDF